LVTEIPEKEKTPPMPPWCHGRHGLLIASRKKINKQPSSQGLGCFAVTMKTKNRLQPLTIRRKLEVNFHYAPILFVFVLCVFLISSGGLPRAADDMNAVAERYVHLVLALGSTIPTTLTRLRAPE